MSSLFGFGYIVFDPLSKIVTSFLGSDFADYGSVAGDKESWDETPTHEDCVDDERHEPDGMNENHPRSGEHVGSHIRLFLTKIMREVLKPISGSNGKETEV